MFDHASAGDVALALIVAGALFLARFLLVIRRLRRETVEARGIPFRSCVRRAAVTAAFGPEREPERRYAMRQCYVGATFAVLGLATAAWLLIASVLGPFVARALGE